MRTFTRVLCVLLALVCIYAATMTVVVLKALSGPDIAPEDQLTYDLFIGAFVLTAVTALIDAAILARRSLLPRWLVHVFNGPVIALTALMALMDFAELGLFAGLQVAVAPAVLALAYGQVLLNPSVRRS